ncbi:MAG: transketolase [Candidatus Krumholzibacteriia bacterium]
MPDRSKLEMLTRLIRRRILEATTRAGSGHPTSSLSAVELMTALMFDGHFRYDADRPEHPNNDRLIFSKGHASPLFYALWLAAGKVTPEQMMTYRDFDSALEGHPTLRFPYTEAATGSLGQGLSVGVGMALAARKLDDLSYRTYVLLGDSEMAEGSQWEAMAIAAHYGLDNLVGVLDVNRLGQRGETMSGRDLGAYARKAEAFGWHAITLQDGHDLQAAGKAFAEATATTDRPTLIIASTVKGKGVPEIEDQDGWHGKTLNQDQLARALEAIGEVDEDVRGELAAPVDRRPDRPDAADLADWPGYELGDEIATRDAYGHALNRIYPRWPLIVSLDAEVGNSTRAEYFKQKHPDRFLEMYVAEQNMVGVATGLARRGHKPFVSSFAAFLTRAFDQIRMARYSDVDIVFCGSHAGVSIGEDGPSQMGLEDIAMFRTIVDSTVLYPADAVATERLVEAAARTGGIVYLRTHRSGTPVIYGPQDEFAVGGCKVLRRSSEDEATIVAAGVTVPEALAAYGILQKRGFAVRVIDLYSVKPLDEKTLLEAADDTGLLVTVEDHAPAGGLGEAVAAAVGGRAPVRLLAVTRKPRSGKPDQLLGFEGIDARAIVAAIEEATA